jgi:multiple sugar transport system ATP-binding protein
MATVELKGINKVYEGGVQAVYNAEISIQDKEFIVLVGPSGCGKTTTLRMIAGLEDISSGELYIDGEIVNDKAPKDRDIAMVFQNYALYPHMTVYDNMSFGLRIRKFPKQEIDARVQDAAAILELQELLDRRPKALSGGQRQRVAVGRAIVRHPKVFLFDEPLSNLDAKLRVQMRAEISSLHTRLQATMIYVTHDQIEAMTMGDRIVVMRGGLIQQIGDPLTLYNKPVNKFVAGFIGSPPMNLIGVKVIEQGGSVYIDEGSFKIKVSDLQAKVLAPYNGQSVTVGIRPEDFTYDPKAAPESSFEAAVEVIEPLGSHTDIWVQTDAKNQIIAIVPPHIDLSVSQKIRLVPNQAKMTFFDDTTENAIIVE